jgi:hypothetical protein
MDINKIVKKDNLDAFQTAWNSDENLINYKDEFGNSLLLKAIFFEANSIAKYLISLGVLIDSKDNDGWDICRKAILVDNIAIMEELVKNKLIDPDSEYTKDILLLAIDNLNIDMCKILFKLCNITNYHKWYNIIITTDSYDIKRLIKIEHKKIVIEEPVELYPRDDLEDPYSMVEISPGTEYAVRKNNNKYYCMGTKETIDILDSARYKVSSDVMIFDLVNNIPVFLSSLSFCTKNKCPDVVKKIYNKTFTKEDFDPDFKDPVYGYTLLKFASLYDNNDAENICIGS